MLRRVREATVEYTLVMGMILDRQRGARQYWRTYTKAGLFVSADEQRKRKESIERTQPATASTSPSASSRSAAPHQPQL